jgi:hypothetical protein
MDSVSMNLNPPRFVRRRKKPLINLHRSPSRVWPLAVLNQREPIVLGHTVASHRDTDHHGIELAYPRVTETDAATSCPINTSNDTATHIMPTMAPALAVDDGVIVFAGTLGHSYGVTVYHGGGWASHYANLQALCVIRTDLYRPREQNVRAGDSIGIVGGPTLDAFRRLYFEWWRDLSPTDPRPYLAGWPMVQHFNHFTPAPPAQTQTEGE